MSTRHPATVTLSFAELARHGGLVGPHRDGWGLAYYEGRDAHLFREAAPAATSASLRFLQEHPFTATTVVGHIQTRHPGPPRARQQPAVRPRARRPRPRLRAQRRPHRPGGRRAGGALPADRRHRLGAGVLRAARAPAPAVAGRGRRPGAGRAAGGGRRVRGQRPPARTGELRLRRRRRDLRPRPPPQPGRRARRRAARLAPALPTLRRRAWHDRRPRPRRGAPGRRAGGERAAQRRALAAPRRGRGRGTG